MTGSEASRVWSELAGGTAVCAFVCTRRRARAITVKCTASFWSVVTDAKYFKCNHIVTALSHDFYVVGTSPVYVLKTILIYHFPLKV